MSDTGFPAQDGPAPQHPPAPVGRHEAAEGVEPRQPVIVVGIDGSETSIHAGAYAAGTARRLHAVLVCVYVHTVGGITAAAPAVIPAVQEAQRDVVAEIKQTIADAQRLPWDEEVEIELVERTGNPFKEIVAVATERKADAVVVGASMQAGHRLVGSLAVHLVKTAQWPVTVVP